MGKWSRKIWPIQGSGHAVLKAGFNKIFLYLKFPDMYIRDEVPLWFPVGSVAVKAKARGITHCLTWEKNVIELLKV